MILPSAAAFNFRVANDDVRLGDREKISGGIICERHAFDSETKLGALRVASSRGRFPPPASFAEEHGDSAKKISSFEVLFCAATGRSNFKLALPGMQIFSQTSQDASAARVTLGILQGGRRRHFLEQQNFIVVTVNLDIAWFVEFERNRPLDFPHFPTVRQLPFDLGGDAGIAWKLPIRMPIRDHVEEQPDSERFSRDNSGGVGENLGLGQAHGLRTSVPGRGRALRGKM